MKSVKTKENIRFWCISAVILICYIAVLFMDWIAFDNRDMYSYILTISSVMGGFMFAGLGILVSAIATDTIRRYWNAHYLDNLYRTSAFGLACDVLAMILAFVVLYVNPAHANLVICQSCVGLAILGLVYFVWSTIVLLRVFKRLKNTQFKHDGK